MNNNNTVIPGIGIQPNQPARPVSGVPAGQAFFPQSTVIPGVSPQNPVEPFNKPSGQILGFLFSVSRSMAGEYWPIMLGANNIGRGSENSIVLDEMTVSTSHASIHAICRSEKLTVYIKDDQSKTGTLLNGELLRSEADLKNGDVITIGEHYELYVVLLNATEIGLKPNPDFQACPSMPSVPLNQFGPQGVGITAPPTQPRPSFGQATVVEGQSGSAPVGGHTIIMTGK